jgi:BirA family biotin operon repressor/biotin-[acetyl-CoA-carboxylase] ligase
VLVGETGSTNADLLALAGAGAPEGTVVLAERQSAGRGRLGRRWLDAPGGSVLCSALFRPRGPRDEWHLAGWIVALAAADAATAVAGVECFCKWPNDLLAGDEERKVAGVLAEVGPGADPALVVGIGVNCNWPAGFPPAGEPEAAEVAARAVSLDRLAGRPVDRDALAAELLRNIARRYRSWHEVDRRALQREYRERCSTIGRLVRVQLADEVLTGRVLDVDDAGRLCVDVGACVRVVDAGDVVHLRPGGTAGHD